MQYRRTTANEAQSRLERLINAMWNSTNPRTRFAMRRAFLGVKPTAEDFVLNIAFMLFEAKETPEE